MFIDYLLAHRRVLSRRHAPRCIYELGGLVGVQTPTVLRVSCCSWVEILVEPHKQYPIQDICERLVYQGSTHLAATTSATVLALAPTNADKEMEAICYGIYSGSSLPASWISFTGLTNCSSTPRVPVQ